MISFTIGIDDIVESTRDILLKDYNMPEHNIFLYSMLFNSKVDDIEITEESTELDMYLIHKINLLRRINSIQFKRQNFNDIDTEIEL